MKIPSSLNVSERLDHHLSHGCEPPVPLAFERLVSLQIVFATVGCLSMADPTTLYFFECPRMNAQAPGKLLESMRLLLRMKTIFKSLTFVVAVAETIGMSS